MGKWTTVSITTDLLDQVDEIVEKTSYASKSEFVRDAVRRLIQQHRTTIALTVLPAKEAA